MDVFKECLPSLTTRSDHLLDGNPFAEKEYNSFIVNRAFSQSPDLIFYAELMNTMHHIDKKIQYDFYYYGIDKRKRYDKWSKRQPVENLELVQKYYSCSEKKAKEYLKFLTQVDIKAIYDRLNKGDANKQ